MSRNELDPQIGNFQHESQRRRAPEALQSLQKIASIVKPIMRQRNWVVGTLCEFYPDERSLLGLNINGGEKICIRLRYPGDDNQFLPLEEVVDTMLHELCHIVVGPHNEQFHALWNQLRDEHEALLRKGYTGEGFLGRGKRLGGGRIPMHEAKRRARAAAEKRRQLTAGSGQKLGGAPILRGTDMRAVIADAVLRRLRVERGCASGTDAGRKVARDVETRKKGITTTKAEEDDENERAIMQAYIELIQEDEREKYGSGYVPPTEGNPAGMRATPHPVSPDGLLAQQANLERSLQRNEVPPAIPTQTKPLLQRPAAPQPPRSPAAKPDTIPDTWTCEICTLVNPMQYLTCDACSTERPPKYPDTPHHPRAQSSSSRRTTGTRETPNALKPRLGVAASLAKLDAQEAARSAKPLGWTCSYCGNWMEQQWWTCANCSRMRDSS